MDGEVPPQESGLHPADDRAWVEDLGARLKLLGCGPALMRSHHPCCWAVSWQQNAPPANRCESALRPFCAGCQWHRFPLSSTQRRLCSLTHTLIFIMWLSVNPLLQRTSLWFILIFGVLQISGIKISFKPMIANKVLRASEVFFPSDVSPRGSTACGLWHLNQRRSSREPSDMRTLEKLFHRCCRVSKAAT